MKQEHRLVAELYRFIAPFIDTTKDIFVSLDGQAASTATKAGRFADAALPDLWFTFLGAGTRTLIEAKIIENEGKALLMQSQLAAWRSSGSGAYKPKYWVAANRSFDRFYFWKHEQFLSILDKSNAKTNTLTLYPPPERVEFLSIPQLALHLLREG
jgi:hypothetical protein